MNYDKKNKIFFDNVFSEQESLIKRIEYYINNNFEIDDDFLFETTLLLMLKELEKHKSKKNAVTPMISKTDKSKIDISYFSLDDEDSSISL